MRKKYAFGDLEEERLLMFYGSQWFLASFFRNEHDVTSPASQVFLAVVVEVQPQFLDHGDTR